ESPRRNAPVRPPAGTRRPALAAGAARAVHRQPTGSGPGPPCPAPRSQSFSRGYGSILPTSLAYIVPSTAGRSPWRPDAVMSTTGVNGTRSSGFSRVAPGRTGHHATCGALPARRTLPPAEPFPSAPTAAPPPARAPGFAADRRALLLIGASALAPTAGYRSRA
ncbi:unnamed protein product, partial [Prunus brigantina]